MSPDIAFFQLFERLSPLLAMGKANVSVLLGHEVVARGIGYSGETATLALSVANALPSIRARWKRAGLIVETPDHVSHFVRLV